MLLHVLLLSPKQPITPVITSAAPAANPSSLKSKAGIIAQVNYAVFAMKRVGGSAVKLAFQFSYCGTPLCALVCMQQQTRRDPSSSLNQIYHQSTAK